MSNEKPKNRQHETMTMKPVQSFRVRVWRTEQEFKFGPDPEVLDALSLLLVKYRFDRLTPELIADAIEPLERVAAYEILDLNHNGVIVYPDWN